MNEFQRWWSTRIGTALPLGWWLREELHHRWLRVHTLPASKRYAESDVERGEVLRRQHRVGEVVLGLRRPCWFVVPTYQADHRRAMQLDELPGLDLEQVHAERVDEEYDTTFTFWAATAHWDPEVFTPLLGAIADDRRQALWASEDGEIVAPYDGGIDIIAASKLRKAEWKRWFTAWLAPGPGGQ